MRNPIAADRFYSGNPVDLQRQIEGMLIDAEKEDIKVAIVPHAGYEYSGKCAGEVYSRIDSNAETIILLGPNHTGFGNDISLSLQGFLTPLGKVESDLELAKLILEKGDGFIFENEDAHNPEHSLEVQLPFLQYILGNFKIVPILLKNLSYDSCVRLAKILFDSIQKTGRNVKVIISSDFSHYGEVYGFVPFKEDIRNKLYELGEKVINFILDFDSEGFYEFAIKNTTVCGIFSITVGIELAKLFGCKKAEKVCFYTSGDITGDYDISVNYAGIVFK